MEPEVTLIGYKLPPGSTVSIGDKEDSENYIWTIHVTQFALADMAKPGRNVVHISKDGGSAFVLGTLERGRCEQFTADLMIRERVKLSVTGDSEVHLTGYLTTTELLTPDDDFDELDEDDKALLAAETKLNGREYTDDGLDEEEEEELESDITGESSDEDQAEKLQEIAKALRASKAAGGKGKGIDNTESDPEDSDFEDEDESDVDITGSEGESDLDLDEAEDEEEVEGEELTRPKKAARKRPAADNNEKPAKKQKAVEGQKSLLSADKGASKPEGAWEEGIRKYIAREGPTNLSALGSAVKKPPGVVGKLKKLIEDSSRLTLGSNGVVSIRK